VLTRYRIKDTFKEQQRNKGANNMISELRSNKHKVTVHVIECGRFGVITEKINMSSIIELTESSSAAICLMIKNFKILETSSINKEL
tara:strand:- start:1203 stop:1463 length:261 start_codon:yes stop_codon:yes gene_type:complete